MFYKHFIIYVSFFLRKWHILEEFKKFSVKEFSEEDIVDLFTAFKDIMIARKLCRDNCSSIDSEYQGEETPFKQASMEEWSSSTYKATTGATTSTSKYSVEEILANYYLDPREQKCNTFSVILSGILRKQGICGVHQQNHCPQYLTGEKEFTMKRWKRLHQN